jgi:hypothetical protein
MDSISTDVWKRRGSSIVFHQESLGPLIADDALISLRQVLGWIGSVPSVPPISGLETVIETMAPQEAEEFLSTRMRPLLVELQNRWTECGVVFGFSSHEKAFEETPLEEEVLFRRRDRKTVKLSESLWDGSASMNMKRIIREGEVPEAETVVGYYVARIS